MSEDGSGESRTPEMRRRDLLRVPAALAGGLALTACGPGNLNLVKGRAPGSPSVIAPPGSPGASPAEAQVAVTPPEDLMREHGVPAFIRMYEPHEAREDTVVFPAFRDVVPPARFRDLGEIFEDEEHRRFGPSGFTGVVNQVADIEKSLGIYNLSQFTPRV
ncbi:hypothetical protein ACQP1V_17315 [Microtetraspora malaysiensis]|uniref:hypothetical protein n=1 Tax=Microtetraspora malaysiensis TaxID=161358 RepID=UPI003D8F1111